MKIWTFPNATWLSRRSLAWASYDVASSVYFGVAPAVLLPLYFVERMSDFDNPTAAWGALATLAVLVSSIAALGAASAARRLSRLGLLTGLTAGLLAAIAALAWNPAASLFQAALAYVAAQSFYFAAMTIYESYLPDLLPAATRQKLSGFGWGIGYLGGLFAIIVLLVFISGKPQSPGLLQGCLGILGLISAVFFAIVITFMRREGFARLGGGQGSPQVQSVFGALRHWRSHRRVVHLLLGTMLIQSAVFVVVTFTTPILAGRFGQSLKDLLTLLLIIHVVAVPATFGWSYLMTGWSRLITTAVLFASWGVVLLLLAFGSGPWMPIVTITVIGCCLGATAATLRGFLAESVGTANPVALFALATVAGRIAAALGPALFSLITLAAGERIALLVILLVLACGSGIILMYIRSEGRPEEKPILPSPAG